MSDRGVRRRMAVSAVCLLLALIALSVRLTLLHVGTDDATRDTIERNRQYTERIAVERGSIYDCRGRDNIVALDVMRKDVCADPSVIVRRGAVQSVADELARCLGLERDDLAARLDSPGSQFTPLRRFVEEDTATALMNRKLPGVFLRDAPLRLYPHKSFLCHVLGFVNYERVGSAGLELRLDRYLRGIPGYLESEKDARRREIPWKRECYIPPVQGADVFLTLDLNLQQIVEAVLDEVMAEHHAQGAWAVVERVQTGEILAMASRPAFDLNEFYRADANAMLNRAVGTVYEPGSTFKVIAISAALNEGKVTPETVFSCGEHGQWVYLNRVLRDYHPNPPLSVADGVKKSSNILTAKVALELGQAKLYKYLQAYGIGMKTGVDLPGEETGILHPLSKWSGISITRIPIGQGVAVTALQMLGAFCAIANDGCLMRPYMVSRVVGSDGSVLLQRHPEVVSRPITPDTAATMRKLLARVTEDGGTGVRARVAGYSIAGKTGTAQKPVAGGYSSTRYMASFVGFLPAERPEIGMIVVVDEPQPFHTGGVVAGPAFSRIVTQAVRYLDIPPVEREAVARR